MEKPSPHYDLAHVLERVGDPNVRPFPRTAIRGGLELGLDDSQMRQVVLALTRRCFFKSMTTYEDHRIWQDVYYGTSASGVLVYIKITVFEDDRPPVIQFKRK